MLDFVLRSNMSIKKELGVIKKAMEEDSDFAWSWHCNLAMPIKDLTNLPHRKCNQIAAFLMKHLFEIDTSENPNYEHKLK
jgi:hypothetical protein